MKKIFATLLAATAIVACSKNETLPEAAQGDDIVRFSSNLRTYTVKSATALDGKTVKIVAGAPINATTTAEAADNKLTPATEMHWVKDQTSATTFTSVYPADIEMTAAGKVEEYNLLFEGNHDFDYHSAVLTAVAKDVTPNTTVNFEYKHPFAMLLVTVVNQLEGTPAITKVNVSDVIMDGSIDVAAGTVTPGTTAAAADAALKDGKYGVVILPQSAKPVLNITAGEKILRPTSATTPPSPSKTVRPSSRKARPSPSASRSLTGKMRTTPSTMSTFPSSGPSSAISRAPTGMPIS